MTKRPHKNPVQPDDGEGELLLTLPGKRRMLSSSIHDWTNTAKKEKAKAEGDGQGIVG